MMHRKSLITLRDVLIALMFYECWAITSVSRLSWCNTNGLNLTPVTTNVWAAERPFIWNRIDVGGRMSVVKLNDGSLWIHSPVKLDDDLKKALAEIGDVKHIISPNYEHVKYAQEWIDAYPNAISWACPGLKTLKPDIKYVFSIGESSTFHESWPAEMKYLWIDCERIPVIDKPFFNEVIFLHQPSRCLMCTDIYWNYPETVPALTKLWKFGMDKVYLPVYRNILIGSKQKFNEILSNIEILEFDTVIPCHGSIVRSDAKRKIIDFLRKGIITKEE